MKKIFQTPIQTRALTFWTFHALTVPSVEALQTVAQMFQSWGSSAEAPRKYTKPTTLPVCWATDVRHKKQNT